MKIFELQINRLFYSDFFREISELKVQKWVFTPNPEICLKTLQDKEFLSLLQRADFLTSDGIGLYIAYQIGENSFWKLVNTFLLPYFFFNLFFRREMLYQRFWERICGSDLTLDITKFAQEKEVGIVILDLYNPLDTWKVANQRIFTQKLQEAFPKLKFQYYIYDLEKKQEILQKVKNSQAQIFFSTLGMKKQEQSVIEFLEKCPNLKLGLGIGSSFDYVTGFQKRAPKFFRQAGLEWLYRIFTSPNKRPRLKRIYQAVIVFPLVVIAKK